MPVARAVRVIALSLGVSATGCEREQPRATAPQPVDLTAVAPAPPSKRKPAEAYASKPPANLFAYIPPQCYTKTKDAYGHPANPCYTCHTVPQAPNYVDDAELQRTWNMPPAAAHNPWSNLFAPALDRAPPINDDDLLRYVRTDNYARQGKVLLAERLANLPEAWDGDADSKWDGFVPDASYRFDAQGYDVRDDGSKTGWRAFAYAPLPGTFFPTNGSGSDVLMRLAPALRQNVAGELDADVEALNYAIIEALITRRSVAVQVDEARYGVDVDLDGKLGHARQVKFEPSRDGSTRLHYVGKARQIEDRSKFPIAVGLFPLETEFLHSLRYLDVEESKVVMARRMKELRYAKKTRWFTYQDLKSHADLEVVEQQESATGALPVYWEHDHGVYNGQGWLLQAFIEDADGELRPQTHEESAFCVGCHGDIGATTDGMFAFARKLRGPDGGWFHWTQHGFEGLLEPKRPDGQYEYELYLKTNHAGDEFRDNDEVFARFFDGGKLRPDAVEALHHDISTLLVPSAPRALMLDRAYRAVVLEQSFTKGRDAVLKPSPRVYREAPIGKPTGISEVVSGHSKTLRP